MDSEVKLVTAIGTPSELGRIQGEVNASVVNQVVEENIHNFCEILKLKSLTYLPYDRYISLAARYLPYAEEYAPDLVEELKGQAEAIGIDFIQLFAHNCLLDFDDLAYPFLADQILFGCTSFAVSGNITSTGRAYLGQNYDFRSVFKNTGFLLHLKPSIGPESLVWTMVGLIGCAGVNSAGIGVVINNLVPSDSRPGVPHTFIVRKILQQERLGDAVAAIVSARRATGIHYTLADGSGQVVALETTATRYESIYPVNGYLAHANHYLTGPLRDYERFRLPFSTDSIVRYGRMSALLQGKVGQKMDIESIQSLLKDHNNFPYSICRHEGENVEKDLLGKTIGSLIVDTGDSSLNVTSGNPCETQYQMFTCG